MTSYWTCCFASHLRESGAHDPQSSTLNWRVQQFGEEGVCAADPALKAGLNLRYRPCGPSRDSDLDVPGAYEGLLFL
jgi:hypothetical protein